MLHCFWVVFRLYELSLCSWKATQHVAAASVKRLVKIYLRSEAPTSVNDQSCLDRVSLNVCWTSDRPSLTASPTPSSSCDSRNTSIFFLPWRWSTIIRSGLFYSTRSCKLNFLGPCLFLKAGSDVSQTFPWDTMLPLGALVKDEILYLLDMSPQTLVQQACLTLNWPYFPLQMTRFQGSLHSDWQRLLPQRSKATDGCP